MAQRKPVNILFSCAGRRVALVRSFRRAAQQLSIPITIVATDTNPLAPALHVCDKSVITGPIRHRGYVSELLALAKKHKIDLVIPTIDTELKTLAENRDRFADVGTRVLVSDRSVIDICQDKRKTYRFLCDHDFGTPDTRVVGDVKPSTLSYPVFMKPWDGSASRGNAIARNAGELNYWKQHIPNCIVQPFIRGCEYTCDVYVDFDMSVRCVVPRRRVDIRAGEVVKAQTVKVKTLISQCRRLVDALGAGPGLVTIQCFLTPNRRVKFIEINPRFGGGVPLSIEAGADFPKWILQELIGKKPRIRFDAWKDRLYMLRYDDAVWCKPTSTGAKRVCPRS